MKTKEEWFTQDSIYLGNPKNSFSKGLSCGFLNKSGKTEDTTNEHYDRLAMVYVLRGRGHYRDSLGLSFPLNQGDIFFRCPDRKHTSTIDPDSQWHECFVSLRSEWYDIFQQLHLIHPQQVRLSMGRIDEVPTRILGLIDLMRAATTPTENSSIEFEIASLIRSVLVRAQQTRYSHTPQMERVQAARDLIRAQATQCQSIEALLDSLGVSYSRLRSLFREAYGTSPGEYRIQVRIESACTLLESTDLTVKEIAHQLGYADAFTFSKQFKQRVTLSPQQFRSK